MRLLNFCLTSQRDQVTWKKQQLHSRGLSQRCANKYGEAGRTRLLTAWDSARCLSAAVSVELKDTDVGDSLGARPTRTTTNTMAEGLDSESVDISGTERQHQLPSRELTVRVLGVLPCQWAGAWNAKVESRNSQGLPRSRTGKKTDWMNTGNDRTII